MSQRFGHVRHVVRVAGIFLTGLLLFLVIRAWFVPDDFGVEGFYRAGARVDAMALPLAHAGETECVSCHDTDDLRKTSKHARVRCEACHGPGWKHAQEPSDVKPPKIDLANLCLTCHTKSSGKPASFPQVVKATHEPGRACVDCHKPHSPKVERAKGAPK